MKRALLVFVGLAGCASAPAPCPTPATPEAPERHVSAISAQYADGDPVWIRFEERWYPGTIVQHLGREVYEVAYDDFGADWNRVARPAQLRARDEVPEETTDPNVLPQRGTPIADVRVLHAGMKVLVLWQQTWWPAHVVGLEPGRARITYDGYDASYDESVEAARITIPPATP